MSGEPVQTWILLRGLTREARHWGDMPLFLTQQLDLGHQGTIHQVLTLDLPGNGAVVKQTSPAAVRGMLEAARQQLVADGVKPPYALLAMSLGGMVATDWAQRYPDEVARLVLINTSMCPHSRLTERLRPASWPRVALLALAWRSAEPAERTIHRLTCNREASREADVTAWMAIRLSAPVSAMNALRQLIAAAGFRSGATPPRCPVLVLSSSADRLVDARCSAALASAWLAPHYRHPWAGHDLPHDDAPWVAQRVAGWLQQKPAETVTPSGPSRPLTPETPAIPKKQAS
jgi:pimeloyl-ACP methyl ester carboxylesterase